MRKYVEWVSEDVKQVIDLRKQGKTNKEISDIVGHSLNSTSDKIRKLIKKGIIESKKHPKVTKKSNTKEKIDIQKLISLRNSGKTINEIADIMSIKPTIVGYHIRRLISKGIIEIKINSKNMKKISRHDESLLIDLVHSGTSHLKISEIMGLNVNTVSSRIFKLKDEKKL